MGKKIKMVCAARHGFRLDCCLLALFENVLSRGAACSFIKAGRVEIDGTVCLKPATRVAVGQCLALSFPPAPAPKEPAPVLGPLPEIVFEDDSLLVLNKPANLTVHPAPSVKEQTLVDILLGHYPQLAKLAGDRPGIVHRLDKDTSGLLVVAREEGVRLVLARQFASREVQKEYLAFVLGVPEKEQGEITAPIGRHPTVKTRMAVVPKGGRAAKSRYRTLWKATDGSVSLLGVQIFTGRTHQIRVHLSSIGHPVLGDATYGGNNFSRFGAKAAQMARLARRQMLHAWKLGFSHPVTGNPLAFVKPPPVDFLRVFLLATRRPLRIGLTGLAACGKSTVLREFERAGIPVWSADHAVAELYKPKEDGWRVLRARFGDRFASETGAVDKKALLEAMRENQALVREIGELLYPLVFHRLQTFFFRQSKAFFCVAEVPLLVETGWHKKEDFFDCVCTVFCSQAVRNRCLQARGWSKSLVCQVDSWQYSQAQKVRAADLVLSNTGSLDDLRAGGRDLMRIFRRLGRKQRRNDVELYNFIVKNKS